MTFAVTLALRIPLRRPTGRSLRLALPRGLILSRTLPAAAAAFDALRTRLVFCSRSSPGAGTLTASLAQPLFRFRFSLPKLKSLGAGRPQVDPPSIR
jgi:hypothetical protein